MFPASKKNFFNLTKVKIHIHIKYDKKKFSLTTVQNLPSYGVQAKSDTVIED